MRFDEVDATGSDIEIGVVEIEDKEMPDVIKVTDDQVTDAPDIKFITLPDSMIA
jgi:hypothetical protein